MFFGFGFFLTPSLLHVWLDVVFVVVMFWFFA